MVGRTKREQELIESGMYASIKGLFANAQHNIPDRYFLLMADYIDCLDQNRGDFNVDPFQIARTLPDLISTIEDTPYIGEYGRTVEDKEQKGKSRIQMNSGLTYDQRKLYFFHELTHALQTRGKECSFYNGHNGMFLTEGATQYTAEYLFNYSNANFLNHRRQTNAVRGQPQHTCYSPLSEYQLNGNLLYLMAQATGTPMNEVLGMGFNRNGREMLKRKYESIPQNGGKFEEIMDDMEKIYAIDKFMAAGQSYVVTGAPQLLILEDERKFMGNLDIQNQLINKVEGELAISYLMNHDSAYILENYSKFSRCLTTPQLQQKFEKAVQQIYEDEMENMRQSGRVVVNNRR